MKEIYNKTKIQYLINEIKLFNDDNTVFIKIIGNCDDTQKQHLQQIINKNNEHILLNKKRIKRLRKKDNNEEYNIYDFNYFYKLINFKEKFNVKEYNKKWRSENKDYYIKYYDQKLKDNLIHCDICNKNVVSSYFENHKLKPTHIRKLAKFNSNNQMIV